VQFSNLIHTHKLNDNFFLYLNLYLNVNANQISGLLLRARLSLNTEMFSTMFSICHIMVNYNPIVVIICQTPLKKFFINCLLPVWDNMRVSIYFGVNYKNVTTHVGLQSFKQASMHCSSRCSELQKRVQR